MSSPLMVFSPGSFTPMNTILTPAVQEQHVLPISPEYDSMMQNHFSKTPVDRSKWMDKLLKKHPDIKRFREKVIPIDRAIEFGREYLPDDRIINTTTLLSLISQHLHILGLSETQDSLHSEWEAKIPVPTDLARSQLNLIVQRGIGHAEKFWNLTMPGTKPEDSSEQLLKVVSDIIGGAPIIPEDLTPLQASQRDNFEQQEHFIYKQPSSDGKNIFHATVNQLIWILTTDNPYYSDDLLYTICLTSSVFSKPFSIFSKIRDRYRIAQESEDLSTRNKSVEKIYKFVTKWQEIASDTIDTAVLANIRVFIDNEIKPSYPEISSDPVPTESLEGNPEELDVYQRAPKVELGSQTLWGDFEPSMLPPIELARQLTVTFWQRFMQIKQTEYLDGRWDNSKTMHLSPNIVEIVHCNDVITLWVARSILNPPSHFDNQIAVMNYFLTVAKILYTEIGNHGAALSILLAFSQPTPNQIFNEAEANNQIDRSLINWKKKYGDGSLLLNNHTPIAAADELAHKGQPCFPPINSYLNQIGKYEASYKCVSQGVVDVGVLLNTRKLIDELEKFKKNEFCFLPIGQVQDFFDTLVKMPKSVVAQAFKEL